MHDFASGPRSSYYGKADVIVYRLHGPTGLFAASVTLLIYGDAFWPTYATGDNTGLVATDSMKNFIQRETDNFSGASLTDYCRFLAEEFLAKYSQTEGIQVSAEEIPYDGDGTFVPRSVERGFARVELSRSKLSDDPAELSRAGIRGFKLLRLGGSSFTGFVLDEYTTLPETRDRPLHMWLDLDWSGDENATAQVRQIVHEVFRAFESGSIQQVIHQIGTKVLADLPAVTEIRMEANNRTWDRLTEDIFTEPRPPYGVLGLTLRRSG